MELTKWIADVILGAILGFIIAVFVFANTPGFTKLKAYRAAITDCEKSLPRDQTCVITAVPKTND